MGLFRRQLQSSGLCRLDNCNNSERSSRRFIRTNEAPYQTTGRRTLAATLGYKELNSTHFWLSLLSECLSCYLYVFIVCSTRISWTGSIIGHEPNLLAMALSSGIAMMLLILTFRTVHVNPALTIAFLATGRIPIIRAFLYILVQSTGAIAAIAFLYSISIKGHAGALGLDNPHYQLESWQILVVEIVISFVVTMTTFATCNYSSYTNARNFILEQVGQSTNLFPTSSNCDNLMATGTSTNRPIKVLNNSAPTKRPLNTNFRVHPQNNGFLADNYNIEENSEYEYEYDNHRIYSTQQSSSESSPDCKIPPIEEMMQDECQLLAPNGFSLNVTNGQAFVIGLAYTLTSLSGIPASGASLNPARSLGPAFIMNRWDNHWIYWAGPIVGAILAGLFYEFIFNPTRKSSMCYLPKLFRLSAHDMAKVGTKSRLYQQQHQKLSPMVGTTGPILAQSATTMNVNTITTANNYRPQLHHISTMHHSPTQRQTMTANHLINNSTLINPREHPTSMLTNSTSLAHLKSAHHFANTTNHIASLDPMNFGKFHFPTTSATSSSSAAAPPPPPPPPPASTQTTQMNFHQHRSFQDQPAMQFTLGNNKPAFSEL